MKRHEESERGREREREGIVIIVAGCNIRYNVLARNDAIYHRMPINNAYSKEI